MPNAPITDSILPIASFLLLSILVFNRSAFGFRRNRFYYITQQPEPKDDSGRGQTG